PIPDGLMVCHHCDNKPCVRPDHLYVGTRADNTRDAYARGQKLPNRGSRASTAKLTESQVIEIRRRWASPDRPRYAELMQEYGMSLSALFNVVHRVTWKDA